MFSYDVMDEAEAMQERFQLIKEGTYQAVIMKSEDKVSANSGNPMMDMTLHVYDNNGTPHTVRDFLVFTKPMMWKVIHAADSAGVLGQYKNGLLCSNLMQGKNVVVKIGIEEGRIIPEDKLQGKPVGSKYPDKNKVEDYIKQSDAKPQIPNAAYTTPAMKKMQDEDSDVPF